LQDILLEKKTNRMVTDIVQSLYHVRCH